MLAVVSAAFCVCALLQGCATSGAKPTRVFASLNASGRIRFLETTMTPEAFAKQLRSRGFHPGTVVNISVARGTADPLVRRTWAIVAKHGYRNVLFRSAPKAVAVPSVPRQ